MQEIAIMQELSDIDARTVVIAAAYDMVYEADPVHCAEDGIFLRIVTRLVRMILVKV